jgi:hypothetical protein
MAPCLTQVDAVRAPRDSINDQAEPTAAHDHTAAGHEFGLGHSWRILHE